MKIILNIVHELLLGPGVEGNLGQIPSPFLYRKIGFQNDNILSPSNLHCQIEQGTVLCIGTVKIPHPAEIARRESRHIWVPIMQIFCGSDGGTFFIPGTDNLPNHGVHLQLNARDRNSFIQGKIHFTVIYLLSDVHKLSPFSAF